MASGHSSLTLKRKNASGHKSYLDADYRPPSRKKIRFDVSIGECVEIMELLNLDDNCLIEMFKFLNVLDLCSMARTCTRLKWFADRQFRQKFSTLNLDVIAGGNSVVAADDLENVLKCFAPSVKSIILTGQNDYDNFGRGYYSGLMELIVKYCAGTLIGFKFYGCCRLDPDTIELLDKFNKLQWLSIHRCRGDGSFLYYYSNGVHCQLPELKRLSIVDSVDVLQLRCKFPKLEEYHLAGSDLLFKQSELHTFITNHSELKVISIDSCDSLSSDVLSIIAANAQNLNHLEFNQAVDDFDFDESDFQVNLRSLYALKSLKTLKLHCKNQPVSVFMSQLTSNGIQIKQLCLLFVSFGNENLDMISALASLKDLEVLILRDVTGLQGHQLINMCEQLPKLKKCLIKGDYYIGTHTAEAFVRRVTSIEKFVVCQNNEMVTFSP